jgi:pimeloyl-ACP methyl ester carboxylesterase
MFDSMTLSSPAQYRAAAGHARPYARSPDALPGCSYFVYRPEGEYDRTRLLVSVHGITRNALEHVLVFRRWAERLRIPVVAPLFARGTYRRYQTLAGGKGLPSADEAFDIMVADACRHLGMMSDANMHLFGYSGGAQFVHRYAFRRPEAVERMVVGAAGWYTFPDETVAYPQGFAATAKTPVFAESAVIARYPPTLVVVGSGDRLRDEVLNQEPAIDQQQGKHRRARAKRWVDAMAQAAQRAGVPSPCRLQILRGASHAFGTAVEAHGLDRAVVDFLFPDHVPDHVPDTQL